MTSEPVASTAERTLRLIELLMAHPDGWTPQELLLELDLSRSALFVLLRSLKSLGYVEQAGKRGRYTPGPRLNAWRSPTPPTTQDLVSAFYQEMEASSRMAAPLPAPRETLALVLEAAQVEGTGGYVVIAQVEGSLQVRSVFTPGQVYTEMPAAAQVLRPTRAGNVIANGYSLTANGDSLELALPICRDGHTPEAALLLSAPSFRWTAEKLAEAFLPELRETAAHLSYRLGAFIYAPYRTRGMERLQTTSCLSTEEIGALLRAPYAASLACVRPDGRPHVIPVWQEWDGRDFYVIAWKGAQWGDFVVQNPNVSLTVDEPWMPLRRVVVQGCASPLSADAGEIEKLLQRMARRYLGQPAAAGLPQQVQRAFRIQPGSIRGWQGLPVNQAGPAA